MSALETYLAQFNPMQAGKLRKSLERVQGFSGQFHKRHAWAEANFRRLRRDSERGRLHQTDSPYDAFYAISDVTVAVADYVVWLQERELV